MRESLGSRYEDKEEIRMNMVKKHGILLNTKNEEVNTKYGEKNKQMDEIDTKRGENNKQMGG